MDYLDNLITIKESFIVVLDSRNATTYLNGDWNSSMIFNFEDSIRKDDNCILMQVSVLNFSCPNSLYNINETNNILKINNTNYTFTKGNYNALNFQTEFNNLVTGFTITLNSITNKFTITSNSNFTVSGNILSVLGGSSNSSYSSSSSSFTFPYMCNFNGLNCLNILFDNLNTRNIDSYTKTNSSIIQSVLIDPLSPIITYTKTNDYNLTILVNVIDYIQIDLKDNLENYLNLNNMHWDLTLNFTVIRDIPRFKENNFHHILLNGYPEEE